jgi:hypothetical protein
MGPVSDDDNKVKRIVAEPPIQSETQQSAAPAQRVEESADDRLEPGAAGIEEAGYGYGV